jgi:hypothetical protein
VGEFIEWAPEDIEVLADYVEALQPDRIEDA